MEFINTNQAPKAIGPYSQAVKFADLIFCSGQIPLDPTTMEMVLGGIKEQATQVLLNIKGLLNSQNLDLKDVVKSTIFLTDMNDFAEFNNIYADFFKDHRPARSTVQVSRLPKDALIEIEVIAKL